MSRLADTDFSGQSLARIGDTNLNVSDFDVSDADVVEITAASFGRSRTTPGERTTSTAPSIKQSWPDSDESEGRAVSSSCSSVKSAGDFRGQLEFRSDKTASQHVHYVKCLEKVTSDQKQHHVSSQQGASATPKLCIYPRSRFDEDLKFLKATPEKEAVLEYLRDIRSNPQHVDGKNASFAGHSFIQIELHEFWIYNSPKLIHHAWELRGLQTVPSEKAGNHTRSWYLDGILKLGEKTHYIRQVPFRIVSIGGYGEDTDTVSDHIWVQSTLNKGSDVFYQLKQSSKEYQRFHDGFMWTANLSKYFVDFAQASFENAKDVSIRDFKSEFATWMQHTYGESRSFQQWFAAYKSPDFRTVIVANITFLQKEASGVDSDLEKHMIWREILTFENGYGLIPKQPLRQVDTIVTPFVYECFKDLQFGQYLKTVKPSIKAESHRRSTGKSLHLTVEQPTRKITQKDLQSGTTITQASNPFRHTEVVSLVKNVDAASIDVGDVLGVLKDGKDSKWRDERSRWRRQDDCWFVYVQKTNTDARGRRSFGVIWLYRPSDTTCALMKYPNETELFFSQHCNCETLREIPITEDQIVCKVSVDWGIGPENSKLQHFIRQTYTTDNAFITFDKEHRKCSHLREDSRSTWETFARKYRTGDTVLVEPPATLLSSHGLEVAEILDFASEGDKCSVQLRRLPRRLDLGEKDFKPRPNEVIYTDETFVILSTKVHRKCLVRFYTSEMIESQRVPAPYNRDGTGDAFYIRIRQCESTLGASMMNIGIPSVPASLNQGFDPSEMPSYQKLRGIDLYCGGGNFGRGLEEGGAVHNEWAVDLDINAIYTYNANLPKMGSTKLFHGSVNDMLYKAVTGNSAESPLIPMPGEVDFISAGSPCPGFSLLNCNKSDTKGLRNQSLVASVAAYVDFYRPKYAILENVVTMAQRGKGRSEDVLSQLVCCLVGMGYQVQIFNLDAWSFGSPQTRSRLFVSITAPGFIPMSHPDLSHSHPSETRDRSLGKMANGQAFGERQFGPTPFKYVTALEATQDLPNIGDAQTYHCVEYPDHVPSKCVLPLLRSRMELIPMTPLGMSFMKAWNGGKGLLTVEQRHLFPKYNKKGTLCQSIMEGSRGWQRLHPHQLFPTVSTVLAPECARSGKCLHWSQQRLMTVMEARRAQSFPDEEVILGIPTKQWRIIGNSVARTVALALGLVLRTAWLQSLGGDRKIECAIEKELKADVSWGHDAIVPRDRRSTDVDDESHHVKALYSSMDEEADTSSVDSLALTRSSSMSKNICNQRPVTPASSTCLDFTPPSKHSLQSMSESTSRKKRRAWGPASVRNPATLWTPTSALSRESSPIYSILNQKNRRTLGSQETLDMIQSDDIREKQVELSHEPISASICNGRNPALKDAGRHHAPDGDSVHAVATMNSFPKVIEIIDLSSDTSDTDAEMEGT